MKTLFKLSIFMLVIGLFGSSAMADIHITVYGTGGIVILPDGTQKVWVRYTTGVPAALTPTDNLRKKVKGAFAKFLMSKEIGVLITTKPGQYKEKVADKFVEKYPDKKFYFFLDNTHNFGGLKDFPFVDSFVNTMCERIGYDDMDVQGISIINAEDIYDIEAGLFD